MTNYKKKHTKGQKTTKFQTKNNNRFRVYQCKTL